MPLTKKNITVIIVTFKSTDVIHNCIQSISKNIDIIIIENSKDEGFKFELEKKYPNVKCFLSNSNLGMGRGNNFGLKNVKTDFAFILNPDVILYKKTIQRMIESSYNLDEFSIIAPISKNPNYPNYKLSEKKGQKFNNKKPFKVISVDGYAMLLNLKRINKLKIFKNFNYFDKNIFLYLENDDLCKRLIDHNENIFIIPLSKIIHLGSKGTNVKYSNEIELSRNWHWNWSKFYFNKKHFGKYFAFKVCLPSFITALVKYTFYLIFMNNKKYVYEKKISGFFNAMIGKKSWYRPNIK